MDGYWWDSARRRAFRTGRAVLPDFHWPFRVAGGLAELLGLAMPLWLQMGVFAVFSLVFLYVFRRTLYDKIRGSSEGYPEPLNGESVQIIEALEPGAEARIDYRGTKWNVRNIGQTAIEGGTRAVIAKVEGLTLHVEAE